MKTIFTFYLSILFFALALTANAQLTVSFNVTNVTCFGKKNGVAIATASGGTSPYTYSWSITPPAMAALQTISSLAASYYAVTVNDANGATATDGVNITEP